MTITQPMLKQGFIDRFYWWLNHTTFLYTSFSTKRPIWSVTRCCLWRNEEDIYVTWYEAFGIISGYRWRIGINNINFAKQNTSEWTIRCYKVFTHPKHRSKYCPWDSWNIWFFWERQHTTTFCWDVFLHFGGAITIHIGSKHCHLRILRLRIFHTISERFCCIRSL